MKVLVTGGIGYIGSHTVCELIENHHDVVIIDNLYNSNLEVLRRISFITGITPKFYKCDIRDKELLKQIFSNEKFDAVIHFAGLKAVGESVSKPLEYYNNNVYGTLCLLEVMKEFEVKKLVFSSSATVYGEAKVVPIKETSELHTTNPYGTTKLMIENILRDLAISDNTWRIVLLRYFNPIGAHKTGLIGETPNGIPNNLLPYVMQVSTGVRDHLNIFGNDYDTKDGTGVRDYIHVLDLAHGHLLALDYAEKNTGCEAFNLGTGIGYSVLDIVKAYEKNSGIKIKYEIVARRPGDIATCFADPSKSFEKLGFKARYNLDDMCADAWNFAKKNPEGIKESEER